jgi:hypothetical protein
MLSARSRGIAAPAGEGISGNLDRWLSAHTSKTSIRGPTPQVA